MSDKYTVHSPNSRIQEWHIATPLGGLHSKYGNFHTSPTSAHKICDALNGELNATEIMRLALMQIANWTLPPAKCQDWSEVNAGRATKPIEFDCSYETAYGSSGARDYIRDVAKRALEKVDRL